MSEVNARRVFSSILWSVVRVWGNRLGGLVVFLVLARLLSPEDFGIFASLWAVMMFFEIFTDLGMGDALVQRESVNQALINSVFLLNLSLACGICGVIFFTAEPISTLFGAEQLATPLVVSSVAVVFNALGYCQLALCRRNFQYRWLAARSLVATFASGAVGIALALSGYGHWALVAQFVLMAFVNLVMLWIRPVWVPTLKFDLHGLKALLPYSSKLAGSRILDAGSTRFFELGLGALLGSVALGVYSVGSRITQIAMQMLSSVVLDVAHSALSRVSSSTEKLQSAYLNGVLLSSMVAVPAFVILSALSHEICETVFGPQWVQSGEILWAVALLSAVLSVQYMNGAVLSATGKTGRVFVISLCKLLAALAALYFGFGSGVDGVAYLFLFFNLFVAPVSFYFGIRAIDLRVGVLLRELWPFLVASIFVYFIIDFSREYVHSVAASWFTLLLLAFLGLVVYVFSLLLTARRRVVGLVGNLVKLKKGEGL